LHAKADTKANVAHLAPSLVLPALIMGVNWPPQKPPPQYSSANDFSFNINAMLECIPHEDQDVFA
jgi:hypothetical protein